MKKPFIVCDPEDSGHGGSQVIFFVSDDLTHSGEVVEAISLVVVTRASKLNSKTVNQECYNKNIFK